MLYYKEQKNCLFRCIVSILAILIIIYISALLITRTSGFRYLLSENLSKRFNLKLNIDKSHLTFNLNLILGDIHDDNEQIFINNINYHWLMALLFGYDFEVEAKNIKLNLIMEERASARSNNWTPAIFSNCLSTVTNWIGFEKSENVNKYADNKNLFWNNKNTIVKINNANISWRDASGNNIASIDGLDLIFMPLKTAQGIRDYYWLFMKDVKLEGDRNFSNILIEVLDLIDQNRQVVFTCITNHKANN